MTFKQSRRSPRGFFSVKLHFGSHGNQENIVIANQGRLNSLVFEVYRTCRGFIEDVSGGEHLQLTPWKIIMEDWKIIFLSQS